MGRLRAFSQQLRSSYELLVLVLLLTLCLPSQETEKLALLRGVVRDSQGTPIAGATVHLQPADPTQTQTVLTNVQGNYSFVALRGGVYVLRAELAGYTEARIASLFVGPKEAKNVDLILLPTNTPASQSSAAQAPQFFDEPQFAVAGVTDTTNLGGHGSDTIVRTRETLAKETVSLSKTPANAAPVAVIEAEKRLRDKVEREPGSFEADHLLGKLLDNNGRARDAIPYLERARELKPSDDENSYDLALANAHAGNDERARVDAEILLKHSDQAEVHHLLGDVQEKLGNSLEAVREYQRAAEMDPREPYVFDWGSELLLHRAPEPAVDVFTKGNRLFPHSVRMLIGLSAAWFARGSDDQAVQRICEASDLNPDDPTPYLFMGKMQNAESASSEQIVERLKRFVDRQPENAQANYYYAVGLWKLRKATPDTAHTERSESMMVESGLVESMLNHAIRLDPKFAAAYVQLGILHSERKDYPRAISDYRQAIQADPKLEEAHFRLAQDYRKVGDADRAAAELEIYNQIAEESAQAAERERHEIRQFVYVLRDQPPAQVH